MTYGVPSALTIEAEIEQANLFAWARSELRSQTWTQDKHRWTCPGQLQSTCCKTILPSCRSWLAALCASTGPWTCPSHVRNSASAESERSAQVWIKFRCQVSCKQYLSEWSCLVWKPTKTQIHKECLHLPQSTKDKTQSHMNHMHVYISDNTNRLKHYRA